MRAAFCIASGPSLTVDDCNAVAKLGVYTIACNLAYRLAPFANILYGMDRAFWRGYYNEIEQSEFKGRLIAPVMTNQKRIELKRFPHGRNSGHGAIILADLFGFDRIYLLGYDCKYDRNGRRHFHGNHKKGMGNAERVNHWLNDFDRIALKNKAKVINCSRSTAIRAFEKQTLEDAICELQSLLAEPAPALSNIGPV